MARLFNFIGRILYTIIFYDIAFRALKQPQLLKAILPKYTEFYNWLITIPFIKDYQNFIFTPNVLENNLEGLTFKLMVSLIILSTAIVCFVPYVSLILSVLIAVYLIVCENVFLAKFSSEVYSNLNNIAIGVGLIGIALMLINDRKEEKVSQQQISKKDKRQKKKMQKKEEVVEKPAPQEVKKEKKDDGQKEKKKKKK